MSGGKGGSQSSQVEIPGYMEDALRQQLARAQAVQNMPYAPVMGPTMAGFTSGQKAGMESQAALAQRMGIIPESYDVTAGYMPGAEDVGGGLSAYASYPGAQQRIEAAYRENPQLQRAMEAMYTPETYEDFMKAQIVDKARESGTLDALVASGALGDGGDNNGMTQSNYASNTPSSLQFALAEAGLNLRDNPFGVLASPLTALGGSIADQSLIDQGYSYVKDPNAKGGGFYTRQDNDRTYGSDFEGSTPGQSAAMRGWSE